MELKDKEKAYSEASKFVSPFIDNIPTHCTGAAIDMTLFRVQRSGYHLLEMGKFRGKSPGRNFFSEYKLSREGKPHFTS